MGYYCHTCLREIPDGEWVQWRWCVGCKDEYRSTWMIWWGNNIWCSSCSACEQKFHSANDDSNDAKVVCHNCNQWIERGDGWITWHTADDGEHYAFCEPCEDQLVQLLEQFEPVN